jgi:hypothetical protein
VLLGALSAVSLEAAFADDTDPFRRSLPAEAFEPGKEAGYLTLAVENDMFADGHDRYYTSGVRVTWMQLSTDTSGLSRLVLNAFGADPTAAPSASYVSFGQNLYTRTTSRANDRILRIARMPPGCMPRTARPGSPTSTWIPSS